MAKKKSKGKKKAKVLKKALKSKKPKAAKKVLKKAIKKAAKKPVKTMKVAIKPAKPLTKPVAVAMPKKNKVGEVTHFYSHISVAVVKLEGMLKEGDKISIEGATTNLTQTANSMQINHQTILEARPGDEIGLKVKDKVREGDAVYKL